MFYRLLCLQPLGSASPSNEPEDLESGISLLEKHQYEEAVRVLRRAVGEAPNSPDAHNYYGFALARSGNLTESVAEFEVALKLKPDHAEALYNLGCAFLPSLNLNLRLVVCVPRCCASRVSGSACGAGLQWRSPHRRTFRGDPRTTNRFAAAAENGFGA